MRHIHEWEPASEFSPTARWLKRYIARGEVFRCVVPGCGHVKIVKKDQPR